MRFFLLIFLVFLWAPARVAAQTKIIAQVNDDIISELDLKQRLEFIRLTKQADVSKKGVRDQILKLLIDEKLKQQAAKAANVTVADEELKHAVKVTLEQNGMSYDKVVRLMKENNLPLSVMEDQIKTDLLFVRAIRKTSGSRAEANDAEVDSKIAEMQEVLKETQYLISEIVLPVKTPDKEDEVYGQAIKLIMRLQDGEKFEDLAKRNSKAASAGNGGLAGWVPESALSEQMKEEISLLEPGQLANPVLEKNEYKIVLLRAVRSPEDFADKQAVRLAQMFLPKKMPAKDRKAALQGVKMTKGSCEQFIGFSEQLKTTPRVDIGQVLESDLPPPISALLNKAGPLQPTQPLKIDEGELVFMVCAREKASALPSREAIKTQLESKRLEAVAQRRLRELRREAITEIRQ